MEVTICNPQKEWIETIEASMNEKNTTTDLEGNFLIKENNFNCSVLIYGVPPLCQDRWGEKTLQITFLI